MVLSFFQKDAGDDIPALIAKKNYSRAIEVIRQKLKSQKGDQRLRMQLADVLVQAGKRQQAVTILLPIADEYANEGFAPKAIAVLKKIQKIDPSRSDIDARLASLIQAKQRVATVELPASSDSGIIEIGFEPGGLGGSVSVPVAPGGSAGPPPEPAGAELGFEPEAPAFTPEAPVAEATPPAPVVDQDLYAGEPEESGLELELDATPREEPGGSLAPGAPEAEAEAEASAAPEPELHLEAEPLQLTSDPEPPFGAAAVPELMLEPEPAAPQAAAEPEPAPQPEPAEEPLPLLDAEPELEPTTAEPEPAPGDPMSDSQFADELMSVLEEAFPSGLDAPVAPAPAPVAPAGAQIVVSPLFRDFSVDEMVEVIAGLKLLTFEAGDIIITQGERGDSLYMLTSGTVKASVRNAQSRQVPVAELEEGSFFGEMSMLSGEPRTATVVAAERCELLELDRATLDGITQRYPHVLDVLREFAAKRALEQQRRRSG